VTGKATKNLFKSIALVARHSLFLAEVLLILNRQKS